MTDLPDSPRLLVEASLRPIAGTRFQPTGFPDIGAGTYRLPDDTEMILVESAQSVANRLEAVCWDEANDDWRGPLRGLPLVAVTQDGAPLTNSILEAHRLNSAYIMGTDARATLEEAVGFDKKRPFDQRKLAKALMRYDPNSLLHGIFLEKIAGVVRLPRALSGFIEARNVRVVSTGGVKNDRVDAGTAKDSKKTAKEGFGNVPFHRDEYAAERITAFFTLDLALLRSLGLGAASERLLYAWALWKIRAFLDEGLRLRTACDLDCIEVAVRRPSATELPTRQALESMLPGLIDAAALEAGWPQNPADRRLVAEYAG